MIWRVLTRSTALATFASLASGKIYFKETFDDEWHKRWVHSEEATPSVRAYFEVDTGRNYTRDFDADRGLYTPHVTFHATPRNSDGPAADKIYAASAHFEPFSNRGKTLYIQYQVKVDNLQNGCYAPAIRLGPKMDDPTRFDLDTPYYIRFGPDYCETIEGKHLRKLTAVEFVIDDKPIPKTKEMKFYQAAWGKLNTADGRTKLYRMTIKPDNTVRIDVDGKKRYKGPMHLGWDMMEEPRYIKDVNDKKPKNWADEEFIETGRKPGWWVDEEMMPVAGAKQPDDWDEDEDGVWGPPLTKNPDYKGEWKPREIDNPEWKGAWEARMIDNPAWEKDNELYIYEDIAYVGFKWEDRKGGILVDNIIITDNKKEADEMKKKWESLKKFEDKHIWMNQIPEEDYDLDIFSEIDEDL